MCDIKTDNDARGKRERREVSVSGAASELIRRFPWATALKNCFERGSQAVVSTLGSELSQ